MTFLIWFALIVLVLSTRVYRIPGADKYLDLGVSISLQIASWRIQAFTNKIKSLTKED